MRWDIFILVIFFIIIFPITLNIKISINAVRNTGTLFVMLFCIFPIYIQQFEMDKGVIKFIKNPKKIHEIKLSFKRESIKKFNNVFGIILCNQIIKEINIKTKFGIKNSPSFVALISGFYNMVIGNFLSINLAKGNILKTKSSIKTYFKYTYLKSDVSLKVSFSLYLLLSVFLQIKLGVSWWII